jgi:ATP-binding protein involved in chromosome partitioning
MTSFFLESALGDALKTVYPPGSKEDIVTLNWVQHVAQEGKKVSLVLEVPAPHVKDVAFLEAEAAQALKKLPGVETVQIVVTSPSLAPPKSNPAAGLASSKPIPGVSHLIAVASGKGGVGKSTTALNLALAFSDLSLKVGLLDLDIYGPSLPHLLGRFEKPMSVDGKTMEPLEAHGITCMSMGFLMPPEKAAIWRGPMVHSAVQQMLHQVNWGTLDLLLLDMPPGTGDVALSLAQLAPLTGAIMVSTPQELALLDVRRAIEMLRKVKVPLLGLIENMSYFACPSCGTTSHIFHHHGAKTEASKQGIPFLGEIPLSEAIRQACDAGKPVFDGRSNSPLLEIYRQIARNVWEKIQS